MAKNGQKIYLKQYWQKITQIYCCYLKQQSADPENLAKPEQDNDKESHPRSLGASC